MSIPKNAITRVVNSDISQYLSVLAGDPEPIVLEMEAYAREKDFPLVGRSSGRWLELLTKMIGGRRVFEFGSGYGFSAYWFARAVGEDGTVIGSEKDEHELDMHLKFFANSTALTFEDSMSLSSFTITDLTLQDGSSRNQRHDPLLPISMPRVIINCASAYVIHTSGPTHGACHKNFPSEIRLSDAMNSTAPTGTSIARTRNDSIAITTIAAM